MANPDFPYSASASFQREHLKEGKHTQILPMDPNLTSLIGWVIVYWVNFEEMFNGIIRPLLLAANETEENWERRSFRKRKELLKHLLKSVSFESNDVAAKELMGRILGDASDLQWRRNLVAHGHYRCTIAPYSSDAQWTTSGIHKGKPVSLNLDPKTLAKLRHDLAHLCGDLTQFFSLIGTYEPGFAIALPDTQLLSLPAGGEHRYSPIG